MTGRCRRPASISPILDLIGVAQLSVVVSKTDRVPPARVAEVADAIRALAAASGFPAIPVIPVSSATGDGIAVLQAHLATLARERIARPAGAGFRLAVDRCFTLGRRYDRYRHGGRRAGAVGDCCC